MLRFLQFWCKLITCRIFKTCPFCFLHNCYGVSLNVMFPQFPNHFQPFPMVFPHVSPSVSMISSGFSTVSPQCFPHFLFQILQIVEARFHIRYFPEEKNCYSVVTKTPIIFTCKYYQKDTL